MIEKEIEKLKKKKAQHRYWSYRNKRYLKKYEAKRYKKRKNKVLEYNKKAKHISGFVVRDGYKYIPHPTHPNRTKDGYILEHRFIMEAIIGRYLERDEVVHHIDGDRLNNITSNLKLFYISTHAAHHYAETMIDKRGRFLVEVVSP